MRVTLTEQRCNKAVTISITKDGFFDGNTPASGRTGPPIHEWQIEMKAVCVGLGLDKAITNEDNDAYMQKMAAFTLMQGLTQRMRTAICHMQATESDQQRIPTMDLPRLRVLPAGHRGTTILHVTHAPREANEGKRQRHTRRSPCVHRALSQSLATVVTPNLQGHHLGHEDRDAIPRTRRRLVPAVQIRADGKDPKQDQHGRDWNTRRIL